MNLNTLLAQSCIEKGENILQVIKSLNEILIYVHALVNWYCNFVIEITDDYLIESWSQLLIDKHDLSLLIFLFNSLTFIDLIFLKESQNMIWVKSDLIHFCCWHFLILLKKVPNIIFMKIIEFSALEKPCFSP